MFLLILGFPPDFAPFLPEFALFLSDFNDWEMLQVSAACRAAPHHAVAALGANWRDNRKQVS